MQNRKDAGKERRIKEPRIKEGSSVVDLNTLNLDLDPVFCPNVTLRNF